MADLQTIDLKGLADLLEKQDYDNEKVQQIKQQLWKACSEQGFFYIQNHGIDQDTIDNLFAITKEYFSQPEEIKDRDFIANNVGYCKLGKEQFSSDKPDYKETYNLLENYRTTKNIPPVYERNKQSLDTFTGETWKVTRTLLTAIALTLGLEPDFFNNAHTNLFDPVGGFRMGHYPPVKKEQDKDSLTRAGRHSDFGTFTLLFHETSTTEQLKSSTGLQVLSKNKHINDHEIWHDIPAKPGCIIVNMADQLSLWTEGRLHSAVHRVIIPEGKSAEKSRYFIGHFVNPDITYKMYPVPSSIPAPYPAVKTSDGVLKASFGEYEFIYGDTSDNYFLRRTKQTNDVKKHQNTLIESKL